VGSLADLEHFHKYFSHSAGTNRAAVLLGSGFVSAQSQATPGMLHRQSLARNPKILAPKRLQYFFKRSVAQNNMKTERCDYA
jgi:hypothetical protein